MRVAVVGSAPVDGAVAAASIALLGAGTVAGLAGVASGSLALGLTGGATAAVAMTYLMAAGALNPLLVLIVSLPLPALFLGGTIRLSPAGPVTLMVIAAWLAAWGPSLRRALIHDLPLRVLTAFLASYAVAAVFTPHIGAAARELVNMLLLSAALLVAADILRRDPERMRSISRLLAAVAGSTGVLAVAEMAGLIGGGRFPEPSGFYRAALGFGQPNGLGMFLALCLPLTVHAAKVARTGGGRALGVLAVCATAGGVLATLSRGSFFSVLAGSLLLLFARAWPTTVRIWVGSFMTAVAAEIATGGGISQAVLGLFRDWSVLQRAALMLAGVRLFFENPITGVGPGGFAEELDRAGVLVPALWDLQPTPHNAYIQVAAEAGLLGLSTFLILLVVVLRRMLASARAISIPAEERSLRLALLWTFGVVLAEGMVEWPLSHGHGQLVMLVIAAAYARPPSPGDGA